MSIDITLFGITIDLAIKILVKCIYFFGNIGFSSLIIKKTDVIEDHDDVCVFLKNNFIQD